MVARGRRGFTLIELIVVIIIVGILASIAIPMISGMNKRAIATEAITALSTILTQERAYYTEYGHYGFSVGAIFPELFPRPANPNAPSPLDGLYFSQECYGETRQFNYNGRETTFFVASFNNWNINFAPKQNERMGWQTKPGYTSPEVWLSDQGEIFSTIEGLGYPDPPTLP